VTSRPAVFIDRDGTLTEAVGSRVPRRATAALALTGYGPEALDRALVRRVAA
jgi:hypothetical protein